MEHAERLFRDAQTLHRQGRFAEAERTYERAIAAAPGALASRAALGTLYIQTGRPRRAMGVFEETIARDDALKTLCRDTALAETEDARCRIVLENCRHILARYPNYAEAHYRKACALLTLGDIKEARRASEHALVLNPTIPAYYHPLIHTGQPADNAPAVAALEQLAGAESELDPLDRAMLHFLLAKAYEDQGRNADGFAHLTKANALKRSVIAYDEARELAKMDAIRTSLSRQTITALSGAGFASELPVFIIGMPRSGTSLAEQILASHPMVFGAGELSLFPDLLAREDLLDAPKPTPEILARLGSSYAEKLALMAPDAKRIVDKLPLNFRYAGLLHLALPTARIIHVRRDALDTCYSCYTQNFAGDLGFSYDLAELGRYYKAYEALMAHWRTVLPPDVLLEIDYEALVGDLKTGARRMTAHCGLAWDPRCLAFHQNRRAVATASVAQVRQPLYTSAIGRASALGDALAPLRRALGL